MDDEKIKIKMYLNDRLTACQSQIMKYKKKIKMIKAIYLTLTSISIVGSCTALGLTSVVGIPMITIPILSGLSAIATTCSTRFKLEDLKTKIKRRLTELEDLENYIQFVNACEGDLTREKIVEIYRKFQ